MSPAFTRRHHVMSYHGQLSGTNNKGGSETAADPGSNSTETHASRSTTGASDPPPTTAVGTASRVPVKVKKVKRYVTASCARCDTHLGNWTVKTPVLDTDVSELDSAAPSDVVKKDGDGDGVTRPDTSTTGSCSQETSGAVNGAAPTTSAVIPSPAPLPVKAPPLHVSSTHPLMNQPPIPAGAAAAPSEASCIHKDSGSSNLFPSYAKKTWLGPESVVMFPTIQGAKQLLSNAIELDLTKAKDLVIDHQDDITGQHHETGSIAASTMAAKLTATGNGSTQSNVVEISAQGLNQQHLSNVNGVGSAKVGGDMLPSGSNSSTIPHSHWTFNGSGDKVSHALACPGCSFLLASSPTCPYLNAKNRTVIYQPSLRLESTTEVPSPSTEPNSPTHAIDSSKEKKSNTRKIKPSHHDALPLVRTREEFESVLLRSALAPIHNSDDGGNTSSSDGSGNGYLGESEHSPSQQSLLTSVESDECSYDDVTDAADLVILVVGQFWSPYSVSAVTRLSEYKRRQGLGSGSDEKSRNTQKGGGDIFGGSEGSEKSTAIPHRRTVSVPPSLTNASLGKAPTKSPGHKATRSAGGEESKSNRGGSGRSHSSPSCTFLLLDTFHNADAGGGGGVDPAIVLGPDLAATVRCLPIPFFLVWYRGCPVRVTNASQHFRCQRGAIVGLDLARYVDIVVPRIAAEARVAFRRSLLAARAAQSSNVSNDTGSRRASGLDGGTSSLRAASETEGEQSFDAADGLFWTEIGEVPNLKDRPVLDIKL